MLQQCFSCEHVAIKKYFYVTIFDNIKMNYFRHDINASVVNNFNHNKLFVKYLETISFWSI
jgi:hypothetical protein